jgi:hypothetical protein
VLDVAVVAVCETTMLAVFNSAACVAELKRPAEVPPWVVDPEKADGVAV